MKTHVESHCPSCGEPVAVSLDPGDGRRVEYVEDCEVCCRPMVVRARRDADGEYWVDVRGADE